MFIKLRLSFWVCLRYKLAFVCNYFGGFEEEAAMLQVHHLSFQLVLHHIHQGQFINQLLHTAGKFRTTHTTLRFKQFVLGTKYIPDPLL